MTTEKPVIKFKTISNKLYRFLNNNPDFDGICYISELNRNTTFDLDKINPRKSLHIELSTTASVFYNVFHKSADKCIGNITIENFSIFFSSTFEVDLSDFLKCISGLKQLSIGGDKLRTVFIKKIDDLEILNINLPNNINNFFNISFHDTILNLKRFRIFGNKKEYKLFYRQIYDCEFLTFKGE